MCSTSGKVSICRFSRVPTQPLSLLCQQLLLFWRRHVMQQNPKNTSTNRSTPRQGSGEQIPWVETIRICMISPTGIHLGRLIYLNVFDFNSDTVINVQSHFVAIFFFFFMAAGQVAHVCVRVCVRLYGLRSTIPDPCRMVRVWNVCDRVRECAYSLFYAKQCIPLYVEHGTYKQMSGVWYAIIERNHLPRAARANRLAVCIVLCATGREKVGQ